MIERYKGEEPENVVGLEEHKKRPFYKKVSFWVLSALGLFFASCSIYGLVLGSQYVRAVTEAAHIIADGNSSSEEENTLLPKKAFNRVAADNVFYLKLADLSWYLQNGLWFTDSTNGKVYAPLPQDAPQVIIDGYQPYSNERFYSQEQPNLGFYVNANGGLRLKDTNYASINDFVASLGDKYVYFLGASGYQGVNPYTAGVQDGYDTGYDDGRADGYDAAKEEFANPTTIHLSVAAEYYPQTGSFHYEWFVDGEVRQVGDLTYQGSNGWGSVDLYRNPGSTARLVFERIGTRFICEYSTTAFGNDGGYPALNDTNAYDFDDAIWYVPSYYEEFYIRAQGGSAPSEHYSDMYDIFLDPAHNERAHIGLWDEGYRQGYSDGIEDNGRWQSGWNTGYKTGKEEGYTNGYQKGVSDTQNGSKALMNMFVTAFQQPFNQVYRFLNFNLLGINVLSLFTALLTLSVGIIIIKKVL